ncbi:MAG TPA: ATP-binding protein, partial [Acidobacteriota bacterium]|nr:ATP-binding protein [Acidobacteriota bacterium]
QNTLMRHTVLQDYRKTPVVRIEALVSKEQLDAQKADLIRNSTIFIALSFAACLLAGYLLSLSLSRPISRLRQAAQDMSQGNLDARVAEDAGGEIGALLHAFNEMAGQLQENQKKLLQTERIAAWQEIARHLAHEIKNPLTPIRTSMRNLQLSREKAPEKFAEIFSEASESILEEVEKLRRLADEFSSFARLPAPNLKTGNLNELIQKSILLYSGDSRPEIQFQPGLLPEFPFDQQQISQVVHNLVQNAVDAVQTGGMIRICTEAIQKEERLWACFRIEDTGSGMDEETRKQVFTPYFTTKQKGTGLGLAIVHRIVTEHGGKVFVSSETGKGTTFEIWLPAS